MRKDNPNRIIIAHLNINSLRNKFDSIMSDILMISETNLDDTFPIGQFHTEGFGTPIRYDHNQNGGEIMLLAREGISIT